MTIDLTDVQLDALLKRLHLANARRAWRELVLRAEREEWSYRDFLTLLVSEEIAQRQQTRIARMVRRARFPFLKTIDDFNFTYQSTVRLSLLGSALAPDFVTEGRCVIFGGKPGRGKTHLAVAVAYRAIHNGFDALFVTAAELIDDLSAAFRAGRLTETLAHYIHPSVLVVDEVGYLTYGTDAANMLFHVVNDRHRKKRAMIFTTNKPLTGWGRVLHDEDLAHAIVDRILERGRMLTLDGPSMRTRHLGLDDPTADPASTQAASVSGEGARISGIQRPEFPEPTGLVLAAAPELPHSQVPMSRKVATVLIMRLSNDLRGVALLALRGYSLQAASLAASVFEVAHCVAYIGGDESRADAWVDHKDPIKPFRSVKSLTEDVARIFRADDPARAAEIQYRVYRQLCLAKHVNPLLQKEHGHYATDEAVVATNGPDASEESVRAARFALEHATRFTLLSLASFLHNHVPEERQAPLAERLKQVRQELTKVAQAAIADYGQEDPFPGEW